MHASIHMCVMCIYVHTCTHIFLCTSAYVHMHIYISEMYLCTFMYVSCDMIYVKLGTVHIFETYHNKYCHIDTHVQVHCYCSASVQPTLVHA